jgi:hypothetical protein
MMSKLSRMALKMAAAVDRMIMMAMRIMEPSQRIAMMKL